MIGSASIATEVLASTRASRARARSFSLRVLEGPSESTIASFRGPSCSIGSHPSNDLVIDDPSVSRFHCEVFMRGVGAVVRDLDSSNGTHLDGTRVVEAHLRGATRLRLGRSVLEFSYGREWSELPCSSQTTFGSLVGTSVAMRTAFAMLEMAAQSTCNVLLRGETGTGKEGAAVGIHEASANATGPFVIVDCAAIPANLMESELFGHEKGAFTGATESRSGAIEDAAGGTIFLDEIGELPLDLQPKLLRVLESRQVRRLGSSAHREVNLRVVAATHRDLRREVNRGRFREDLYYRLAVVNIALPPLRERPEDIPIIAERLLESLDTSPEVRQTLLSDAVLSQMTTAAWPGNARELRNYLERSTVFRRPLPVTEGEPALDNGLRVDIKASYHAAKRSLLDEFERQYISQLLTAHDGKVGDAARSAGIGRAQLWRLCRRHNLGNQRTD